MFENRRDITIEWGDCDPAGIVYFPRYLAIFDSCTWALFTAALGMKKAALLARYGTVGCPMVDLRTRFLIPCSFGDEVIVESRVAELRRSSFDVQHRLLKAGEPAVKAWRRGCGAPSTRISPGGSSRIQSRRRSGPDSAASVPPAVPGDAVFTFPLWVHNGKAGANHSACPKRARLSLALALPCSAALRYQRAASASSLATPKPHSYMPARGCTCASGVALLGRLFPPANRLGLVPGQPALAVPVHGAELVLRLGVTPLSGLPNIGRLRSLLLAHRCRLWCWSGPQVGIAPYRDGATRPGPSRAAQRPVFFDPTPLDRACSAGTASNGAGCVAPLGRDKPLGGAIPAGRSSPPAGGAGLTSTSRRVVAWIASAGWPGRVASAFRLRAAPSPPAAPLRPRAGRPVPSPSAGSATATCCRVVGSSPSPRIWLAGEISAAGDGGDDPECGSPSTAPISAR